MVDTEYLADQAMVWITVGKWQLSGLSLSTEPQA